MSDFLDPITERTERLEAARKIRLGTVEQRALDGKQYVIVSLPDQSSVHIDAPTFTTDATAEAVRGTIYALQDFVSAALPIGRDARLSPIGKADALRPLQELALLMTASEYEKTLDAADDIEKAEAARYAAPGYSNSGGELYARRQLDDDREVRALLRSMSVKERMQVMRAVENGEAPESILRAVLNSPMAMADDLTVVATAAHRTCVDRLDPVGRLRLDQDAQALEWAQRATAVLAARIVQVTGYRDDQLADVVHVRRGWPVFGLDRARITTAKRRAEVQKIRGKAA